MRSHFLLALCTAIILNGIATFGAFAGEVGDPISFAAGCHIKEPVDFIGQALEDGDRIEALALAEDPENQCFRIIDPNGAPTYGIGIVIELYPQTYMISPQQFMQVAKVHAWNDEEVFTLVPADPLPGFDICIDCEEV